MGNLQVVRAWEGKALGTSKPRPPAETLKLVRGQLRGLGPFRIKRDDEAPLSSPRDLRGTMERLEVLVPRLELGEVLRIKALNAPDERDILRVAMADVEPDVDLPSTSDRWHPVLRRIYSETWGNKWRHGRPYFLGAENCRPNRANEALWSMHSYWPPVLAIDLGFGSKALGDEVIAYHKRQDYSGDVVWVWWVESHYDHGHGQVGSNRSGRPACAA